MSDPLPYSPFDLRSDPPLDHPPGASYLRLIRLAAMGVLFLAGAIFWQAGHYLYFNCFYPDTPGRHVYRNAHYDDGILDAALIPFILWFLTGAQRGLLCPERANPRLLSAAYCTYFGRAILKIYMCRIFKYTDWIDPEIIAFLVPVTFNIFAAAHFKGCRWLLRHATLTARHQAMLARPTKPILWCFIALIYNFLLIYAYQRWGIVY